jgi:hypothetical protein
LDTPLPKHDSFSAPLVPSSSSSQFAVRHPIDMSLHSQYAL